MYDISEDLIETRCSVVKIDRREGIVLKKIAHEGYFHRENELLDQMGGCPGFPEKIFSDTDSLTLHLKYIPGRTLDDFVRLNGPQSDSYYKFLILQQVAASMQHMHLGLPQKAAFVWNDVSPKNVVISEDLDVSLIDFGCSYRIDTPPKEFFGTSFGTPVCMSPEQYCGKPQHGLASDVFSLASLTYYVMTGHAPFLDKRGVSLNKMLQQSKGNLSLTTGNEIVDKMNKDCWKWNPDERPTVDDIRATFEGLAR